MDSFPWGGCRLGLTNRTSRVKYTLRVPRWKSSRPGRTPVVALAWSLQNIHWPSKKQVDRWDSPYTQVPIPCNVGVV